MENNIENRNDQETECNVSLANRIKNILEKNKFRKINGKDIQQQLFVFGINTTQLQIRKVIRELRKEGTPIIASPIGYKLCDLKNEIDRKELGEYIEARRLELRDESITINKLSQVLTNECMTMDVINFGGNK